VIVVVSDVRLLGHGQDHGIQKEVAFVVVVVVVVVVEEVAKIGMVEVLKELKRKNPLLRCLRLAVAFSTIVRFVFVIRISIC